MEKLTVIIPCYNCEATLREAVESCYRQGFSPEEFEIVMVDDGSTDGTKKLMEALALEHKNIRTVFHEKNKGGGATRNTANEHASADKIFCLDSDDILPENALSKMVALMDEKKCDGVGIHRSIKFIGSDPSNIDRVDTFGYAGEIIPFESLLQKDGVLSPLYSTFMHTKAAFLKTGGYPTTHGFDTQGFAWRFLAAGLTAYGCPDAEYLHRTHFNKSYYLREAEGGKINYNWQDILKEHLFLFDDETQKFITSFDCRDFSRNLFNELRARKTIFKENYLSLLGTPPVIAEAPSSRKFIKQKSLAGLFIRARGKARKYGSIILSLAQERQWRPDLLFFFILLRVKKALKAGFKDLPPSTIPLDVVMPTVIKDHSLLSESIRSLRTNLAHPIKNIYIISKDNPSIKEFCDKEKCIFVDEASVLGYGKEAIDYTVDNLDRSGWIFQQLLKYAGDKFAAEENYLVLDSDTILLRPHTFIHDGRFTFFQSEEWHMPYFQAFKKMFKIEAPHKLSSVTHMMIFSKKKLAEMKAEMESIHGTSWDKVFMSTIDPHEMSCVSEYETYANWMKVRYPKEVMTAPFYNKSLGRDAFLPLPDLMKKYAGTYQSVSFHQHRP